MTTVTRLLLLYIKVQFTTERLRARAQGKTATPPACIGSSLRCCCCFCCNLTHNSYWATKADYPLDASDFLRAAHQADRMSAEDYTKKHHGFVEDESVGVGAAIIPGASTTTAGR